MFYRIYRFKETIVALIALMFLAACSGKKDETVLKINDRVISIDEFENRLNNIPQTLNVSEKKLKENLASTLVAESVLAFEAEKRRLDTLSRISSLIEQYRAEALFEKWMDSEIESKPEVTEEEIKEAYPRFVENRNVDFWVLPDIATAEEIRDELKVGKDLSQVPEHKQIVFAEALKRVEDVVYGLTEGEVSDPVEVDSSYYIFKLTGKEPVPENRKYGFIAMKPEIEKRIRTRKQNNLADKVLGSLMADKEFTVNREAYNFLLQQLYYTLYDKNGLKYDSPDLLQLELFQRVINPDNKFDQTIVEFNDGRSWSVMDCWRLLSVSPYPLNYRNPADLQSGLFEVLKRIILLRTVAENARGIGMDESEEVIKQTRLWSDNILAQGLISVVRSNINVSDYELMSFYDSTKYDFMKPAMRKILPIIVRDKSLAGSIYNRIVKGEDVLALGKEYSLNKIAFNSNSPGMFISENMWGDIGKEVFKMKAGEISMPVAGIDTTYAVIKLMETKEAAPYPYEEIRARLNTILVDSQLQLDMEKVLTENIGDYDIYINSELIGQAKYYGGNMGVNKSHFPLRDAIPVFPLFNSNAEWYKSLVTN